MAQNIQAQIAALRRMTPSQLRERYLELFGEPSRSANRDFLYKRLAWRMQSLAEGDLAQRAQRIRARAAELARDADIRTTTPKPPTTTDGATGRSGAIPTPHDGRLPMPGAVLTRQYRGQLVQVTVLPKGFEWEGQVYRSLSAVAKAVTGSHWNGHLFFGLKEGRTQ